MPIYTEQDMNDFCERVKKKGFPFALVMEEENQGLNPYYEDMNKDMIKRGLLQEGSHLQQRIKEISLGRLQHTNTVIFENFPCLYPSPGILSEYPTLTGPMTGNLSNCYDPQTKRVLFQMRGNNVSQPFGFQAAAAGMGLYGEHPGITAQKELKEEARIKTYEVLFNGYATDVLPFMKAGKIPQFLFSFGFVADISRFPVCRTLEEVVQFEQEIKQRLQDGRLNSREAYHFTLPYEQLEQITGELHDQDRFYGPIRDSTMDFIKALKTIGEI